ncbi:hypothetical protein E1N66_17460 [Pantoea allii]|nr:hypothetical protein [Pantoea allii]THB83098.1 hypothetical protein E1N66_17460 [Pantoea allii]
MAYFESEKDVSDRLGMYFISVWEDCDTAVAAGIREFRERWSNYTVHSKRKDPRSHLKSISSYDKREADKRPIGELILEVIDPKVSAFLNSLPERHFQFFPNPYINIAHTLLPCSNDNFTSTESAPSFSPNKYGSKFKEDTPITNLVMVMGIKNAHDVIKQQLRRFEKMEHQYRPIDLKFQATVDNILELLWQLHLTPTRFKQHSADTKLNTRRKQTFCELCGQRNELAEYFYKLDNNMLEPEDEIAIHNEQNPDNQKKLQLSHRYCSYHKQKDKNGRTWNSAYKSALHSKDQFENEFHRLKLHIVRVEDLKIISGDELVDLYFYHFLQDKCVTQKQSDDFFHYVRESFKYPIELKEETERLIHEAAIRLTGSGITLGVDDTGKLREIARHMVDSRLTDSKKRMLVLKKKGFNQRQIADKLTKIEGRTISPQAVSKALKSIDSNFNI